MATEKPNMSDLGKSLYAMAEQLIALENRLREVEKGVFTAPVAGVYYFTFYYQTGKKDTNLELFKNSQVIVRTSEEKASYDTSDSGGNAVVLQLEERDKVYVRMAACSEIWAGDHHTSFSGFLVTKDQ